MGYTDNAVPADVQVQQLPDSSDDELPGDSLLELASTDGHQQTQAASQPAAVLPVHSAGIVTGTSALRDASLAACDAFPSVSVVTEPDVATADQSAMTTAPAEHGATSTLADRLPVFPDASTSASAAPQCMLTRRAAAQKRVQSEDPDFSVGEVIGQSCVWHHNE